MGKTTSDLPEDIEAKMLAVQDIIGSLERKKFDLETSVSQLTVDQKNLNDSIILAKTELEKIESEQKTKNEELAERERKVAQKESALDVYANALTEKEGKINKYLAVFENIKKVVI